MAAPSWTGQAGLRPSLPSLSASAKRRVSSYHLEPPLLQDKASLKASESAGLAVLKVTKTGQLQARRVAISLDRRHLLVTTHRIKSLKGFFKAAVTGAPATVKSIPLLLVDRITRGPVSRRFLQGLEAANGNLKPGASEKTLLSYWLSDHDHDDGEYQHHSAVEQPTVALSIVYRALETNALETLDLVVPDLKDYEILLSALNDLVDLQVEEAQRYTQQALFLQYQWTDCGFPTSSETLSQIGLSEWMALTDRLQVPLKKSTLTQRFKSLEQDRISMDQVADLLHEVQETSLEASNHDPLDELWRDMMQTDPVPAVGMRPSDPDDVSLELSLEEGPAEESISSVALLSFIRSQQKEYATSLEEVTYLVHVLNQQEGMGQAASAADDPSNPRPESSPMASTDRLVKSRFLSFLQSTANEIMEPTKGVVGSDDMTQPLSNYWIQSSHDTYQNLHHKNHANSSNNTAPHPNAFSQKPWSDQALSNGSADSYLYTAALLRGVRCLELDLFDGPQGQPVVAKDAIAATASGTPLKLVLKAIRNFLQEHPYCFPILLKLENQCSASLQSRIGELLYAILSRSKMILVPGKEHHLDDDGYVLPSPEAARGRVIVIGKRPKSLLNGGRVINDDLDQDCFWEGPSSSKVGVSFEDIEEEEFLNDADDHNDEQPQQGVIVGFDEKGPLWSHDPSAQALSAAALLQQADAEAQQYKREMEEAQAYMADLRDKADEQEQLAAQLTQQAGLSPAEVRRRAAMAANRGFEDPSGADIYLGEEKSTKDEGIEVHEVLNEYYDSGRDRYAQAAQASMDASQRVDVAMMKLKKAQDSLQQAEADLRVSKSYEESAAEAARRAASDARMHREHAHSAKERVEKLREMLRASHDNASSASTVVQTALTEAKISEKRAADAEARAARALAVAEKDRTRAEEENQKEEDCERQVSELYEECQRYGEVAAATRERVEKAAAMLARVGEQIKLIENSSQYRRELQEGKTAESEARNSSSFLTKQKFKLEELEICRELIKEASDENSAAERRRNELQQEFDERARFWRIQADLAAQMRKGADRSSHLAEELAEHAEEEREAANLRHVARERAEATVEDRDSQRISLEAQLAEAERASGEAANKAVQSRKRAERLSHEVPRRKNYDHLIKACKDNEWEVLQAKGIHDSAVLEKEQKEEAMLEEKRRLDTMADVRRSVAQDAANETDRVKVEELYQEEAIVAFNKALMLRKQSQLAKTRVEIASMRAEPKLIAARRARNYKEKKDLCIEVPAKLGRLTLLHATRYRQWDHSLGLSSSYVHSLAQDVVLQMLEMDQTEQRCMFLAFTADHLCRVFTPLTSLARGSNTDPVLLWSLGCQIVSMNFQSTDENLIVADGRFRQNGSCGYVLKPRVLRDNDAKPDAQQLWCFNVLAGFHFPRESRKTANPYVKMSLYSGSADESCVSQTTRPAGHNSFNPVWNASDSYNFVVSNASVAMISFSVWDKLEDRDEFVAASALPVSCLREGIRSVALFDAQHSRTGPFAYCSLLVKASKR